MLIDWMAGGKLGLMLTGACNVQEVERNLLRLLPKAMPIWKQFVRESGTVVVECHKKKALAINAKDQLVVGAALAAKVSHFVTGDKRLLAEIKRAGNPGFSALSPRDMLEALAFKLAR